NLILDLITSKFSQQENVKILDVGCGDGSFIIKFKKHYDVFGVDISEVAVEEARKFGVNAYRVDVSCENFPFPDGYFNIVYMGDMIEHLINPDFAIKEVGRVTKFDGFIVLSTPNLASWLNRLLLLFGIQPLFSEVSTIKQFGRFKGQTVFSVGHLRLFTYRALMQFLEFHGFEIVKTVGAPNGLPRFLRWIDHALSNVPSLSSIIIVVCKKDKSQSNKGS
ncbi:MAG: class I SAM-dependent methyltransferase, partial [Candidatus Bathycorpusculaceae bacterium]